MLTDPVNTKEGVGRSTYARGGCYRNSVQSSLWQPHSIRHYKGSRDAGYSIRVKTDSPSGKRYAY